MSSPEQPAPYPGDLVAALPGTVRLERAYRDVLGRPMTGTVTLTGAARTATDSAVVVPAPVSVDLADGLLAVDLPPDTYRLQADLRTADGARATDTDEVVLAE